VLFRSLEDLFTVPANVTGVPALAIPFEKGEKGLPIGFQILGKHFSEPLLFKVAEYFEEGYHA
jgi:aspartyl-tRNA(Asn)/glutamyl-tRNA(Gln) amidotransferase subunit A